ncbi:soluble scavenger receptor cysteine-rich domain-containing protein SSC5D-like isoform X2 [Hemicordylus capensis]|uniref:soluble scavenger receptor cysteine-rich domain-containing protein SSC5D-like isoform X2 n=1 Tax=Hemicordylus capensis TaxID=884348 RepID=UPI002304CB0F|nr:soluble scavenger receptor cysteine-rich domain-containing protein SSC5D-like isoform X2 [Hemicordylus capensis]
MLRSLFFLVVFLQFHATAPFQVRLSGGPNLCVGRVELFHQGEWGTVCDDDWDLRDVAVVCRELDCGEALSAPHGAWFGEGAGPIWLNEVHCMGTEWHLHSCRHLGFRKHVCTHEEDASAICSVQRFPPFTAFPPHTTVRRSKMEAATTARAASLPPAEGTPALRLVGGRSHCSGRLEVFHQGQWGTVCDDMWDLLDAAVVCRELDCGEALAAPGGALFGEGNSAIWLDDVQCQGEESMLADCPASPWGTHNCRHTEDAGAVCSGEMPLAMVEEHLAMLTRTVAPQRSRSTALEITPLPTQPARVQAESVAYEASQQKEKSPRKGPSEEDLGGKWQIRLVGGPGSCAGRLEVLYKDQWGTVCDDGWDLLDAAVVCRELGCGAPLLSTGNARYGPGTGPIWLDDVNCTGAETTLWHCHAQPWGQHNCNHHEDASIICTGRWKALSLPKPASDSDVPELIPSSQDPGPEDEPRLQSTLDVTEATTVSPTFPTVWDMELLNPWYPDVPFPATHNMDLKSEEEKEPTSPWEMVESKTTSNAEILRHVQEKMESTSLPKISSPTFKRGQDLTHLSVESHPPFTMQEIESERENEPMNSKDMDEATSNAEILQHVHAMESTSPSKTSSSTHKWEQEPTYPSAESQPPSTMWHVESARETEPTSPSGIELPTVTQDLKPATERVPLLHWFRMLELSPVPQYTEPTKPSAETQPAFATWVPKPERETETMAQIAMKLSLSSKSLELTEEMELPAVTQNVQPIKDNEVTSLNITEPEENTDKTQEEDSSTNPLTTWPAAAPESTVVPSALSSWDGSDDHGISALLQRPMLPTASVGGPFEGGLMSSEDSERGANITSAPNLTEAPAPNIPSAEPITHAANLSTPSPGWPVRQELRKEGHNCCCSPPALGNLVHAVESLHGGLGSLSTAIQHQGSQLEAVAHSLAELAASVNHLVGLLPALLQPVPAQPSSVPCQQNENQMQNQLPLK